MKNIKKALVAGLLATVLVCSTSSVRAGGVEKQTIKLTPYDVPSPTTSYWNDICYWAYQASLAIS